jgi:hypothetical protein
MKKQTVINLIIVLLCFFAYWWRGSIVLDPDFGWHIRMGQLILQHGIPATDQLSYTMAHYPMIDHEWLTNCLFAIVYPVIDMTGLAFFVALCAVSTLILATRLISAKYHAWLGVPLLLSGIVLNNFVAVRPQVLTWFFYALLLQLLLNKRYKQISLFFIPLLIVLWVNMHGGFAIGVATVLLVLFIRTLEERRVRHSSLWLAFSSIAATVMNPYGLRIWHEIWMQMTDQSLRWTVLEWGPAFLTANIGFWLFFLLAAVCFSRYRKKFSLVEQVLFICLSCAALSSIRHIPLWLLIALPVAIKSLHLLWSDAGKIKHARSRLKAVAVGSLFIILPLIAFDLRGQYDSSYSLSEQNFYPVNAIEYLKTHKMTGNLFSPFIWNGYIVWKLPGTRVFVHGMMPSWRDHHWKGESEYAYKEYQEILTEPTLFVQSLRVYNIRYVLIPSNRDIHYQSIVKQLKQKAYKQIYKDSTATIYKK